jgi:hypothetical protein
MPYADPEIRRQFQREYKRKWRARQAKIQPLLGFKIYICPRFPYFPLARVRFDNGFLITKEVGIQTEVERHREFGKFIFPLALDLTCTPMEDEDE